MQETIVQPDRSTKPVSPRDAAGLFGLWSIMAMLSLLVILGVVLIGALRKARLARARLGGRVPSRYVDAWAEAGKRLPPPADLDDYIDQPPPGSDGNFDAPRRHGPHGDKPGGKGSDNG